MANDDVADLPPMYTDMERSDLEPDDRGSLADELPHLAAVFGFLRGAIRAGETEPLISVLAEVPHRPFSRGERSVA